MDNRNEVLARNLVNYSVKLQKGEKILIDSRGPECIPLMEAIVKEVYRVGGLPFIAHESTVLKREFLMNVTEEQAKLMAEVDSKLMNEMNAYIGIGSVANAYEMSDVPFEKVELFNKAYMKPVLDIRLTKKWVILRYPTFGMAQAAKKSFRAFEDFYYDVCNLDYAKMDKAMDPLKELMESTDKVRIVGEGTDLTFSIKGIPAVKCAGGCNIPDGEIYTAPVKDSVNGFITYNTPSMLDGFTYENVKLEFKDGKIVSCTANDTERITKVFDRDEGARYVGEFAIGVNPYITDAMNNILFDEKIMGSFHFTPGSSYADADNTNRSALHWDLVCIQTPEYGGGEIYFDDVLIRKDGRFVLPQLEALNPENLK